MNKTGLAIMTNKLTNGGIDADTPQNSLQGKAWKATQKLATIDMPF